MLGHRCLDTRHVQGLVDPALEDRNAKLQALGDNVTSLESNLAG